MAAPRTIRVDTLQLRRLEPETADSDDAVLGAAAALAAALAELRLGAGDFATPGDDAVDDVLEHFRRCRVLGQLFAMVADRFERGQLDGHLPSVFSVPPADWVGPWADRNAPAERRWLLDRLAALIGASSPASRREAAEIRRRLGLVDARPFVVATRTIRVSGGMSAAATVDAEVVWELEERSDGSTTVTLRHGRSAGLGVGAGLTVDADCGDVELGVDAGAGLGVDAAAALGWRKVFPSRAEADAFVEQHRFKALVEAGASMTPLTGRWLAARANLSGMQDAPVREHAVTVAASLSAQSSAAIVVPAAVGLAGTFERQVVERRDRGEGLTTDVVRDTRTTDVTLAAGATLVVSGLLATEVAVARDERGNPRSLTLRVSSQGPAGQPPELPGLPRAAPPVDAGRAVTARPGLPAPTPGPAEGRSAPATAPADEPHHYEIEVVVDLDDPSNAGLAEGLATHQPLGGRLDEDLAAVERVGGLGGDVLARSQVTVVEQAPDAGATCAISVSGGVVAEFGADVGVTTSGRRTVAAWRNRDGLLVPVMPGQRALG